MNCPQFQQLTPLEKSTFIGELVHSCISDERFFDLGKKLIKQAHRKGLFDGVKINPDTLPINRTNENYSAKES